MKNEELTYDNSVKINDRGNPILGRLKGPCATTIAATRNGRFYSDELWEKVFNNPIVKEQFASKLVAGELGHPADRQEIDMEKICWIMPEPPYKNEKNQLIGSWDILDTPNGRILKTLCDYGCKIGVSSRGSGDIITDYNGNEAVDPDTYEFTCFDAVLLPAVKEARLEYISESLDTNKKSLSQALNESLNSATEEERKIMSETLDSLHIPYHPEDEENKETDVVYKDSDNAASSDDVEYRSEVVDENVAVDNSEAQLVEQLQASLNSNKQLEQQIVELREKLSVSYAKETECNEKLDQYKRAILKLSDDSKMLKAAQGKVDILEEELQSVKTKLSMSEGKLDSTIKLNRSLNEQLSSVHSKMDKMSEAHKQALNRARSLNESAKQTGSRIISLEAQLKEAKENSTSRLNILNEQLETLHEQLIEKDKDLEMKKTEYSKKLDEALKTVNRFKKIANNAVDRYIQSQAKRLGVSKNEILNRLSESYSFEEIDEVCDTIQQNNVSMSRLPFQRIGLNEKLGVRINARPKEFVPEVINIDDVIDDQLASLAKLK